MIRSSASRRHDPIFCLFEPHCRPDLSPLPERETAGRVMPLVNEDPQPGTTWKRISSFTYVGIPQQSETEGFNVMSKLGCIAIVCMSLGLGVGNVSAADQTARDNVLPPLGAVSGGQKPVSLAISADGARVGSRMVWFRAKDRCELRRKVYGSARQAGNGAKSVRISQSRRRPTSVALSVGPSFSRHYVACNNLLCPNFVVTGIGF
jgi:hypothetical protein